jgi:hypothetical protein
MFQHFTLVNQVSTFKDARHESSDATTGAAVIGRHSPQDLL